MNDNSGAIEDLIRRLPDDPNAAGMLVDAINQQIRMQTQRAIDDAAPHILHDGAEITALSDGTNIWGGPSRFPVIDILGGQAYIHSRYERNRVDIRVGGGGADCMFDYLVSACFSSLPGFTEGKVYTSLPGCTFKGYSKLTGPGYALVDALSTGASKRIFMCGSETATQTTDISSTPAGNALILITGSGSNTRGSQVTLTGPTGLDLFTGDPNKAGGATTLEIQFNGVALAIDTGKAIFSPSADSGNTRFYLQFRNCFFNMPAAGIWRVANGAYHGAGMVDIDNCQGTIQYPCWLQFNGFHSHTESLVIRNCQQPVTGANGPVEPHTGLKIANFWKNDGAANSDMLQAFSLLNSSINLAAQMTFDQGAAATPVTNLTIQNVYLYYTGPTATTALTGKIPSNAQWYFEGIVFDAQSTAAVNFGNFTDSTAGAQTPVAFKDIYGSSSVAQAGTFLTLPGTITGKGVAVSGVDAPQWATVYAGPAGTSASGGPALSDPFVTIGNVADLTAERALTGGSGVGFTDNGANSSVVAALANLLANWAQAGAFDIYHAGALRLGSSLAPLNKTAGDLTALRLALGNVAFPNADNGVVINQAVASATAGLLLVSGTNTLRLTANVGGNAYIDLANNSLADLFVGGAKRIFLADVNDTAVLGLYGEAGLNTSGFALQGSLFINTSATAIPANNTPGDLTATRIFTTGSTHLGGTAAPSASAILDLTNAANLGLLLPVIANASQPTGAAGLVYYDSTKKQWYIFADDGTGTNRWQAVNGTQPISYIIDGSGSVPATGVKPSFVVGYACTILGWDIEGDAAGTCTVDVTKAADAATPTYTSMVGAGTKPNVAGPAVCSTMTAPAGWTTTAIGVNDHIQFNLTAVTTFKWITITLRVMRT